MEQTWYRVMAYAASLESGLWGHLYADGSSLGSVAAESERDEEEGRSRSSLSGGNKRHEGHVFQGGWYYETASSAATATATTTTTAGTTTGNGWNDGGRTYEYTIIASGVADPPPRRDIGNHHYKVKVETVGIHAPHPHPPHDHDHECHRGF